MIQEQSTPSFDLDGNVVSFYNIVCLAVIISGLFTNGNLQSGPNQQYMRNDGRGPPKRKIGMVGTTYRPSGKLRSIQSSSELLQTHILLDDVVIFPYNIPHQAMLVVELKKLADLLERINVRPDLVKQARKWADTVDKAIWKYGVVSTEEWGKVFAYEVDGSLSAFTLSYCHSYTVTPLQDMGE